MAIIESKHNGHLLTFDDVRHRYTLDGRAVPGATTFGKGGYPTSEALIGWQIKHAMYAAIDVTWDLAQLNPGSKLFEKLKDEIRDKAKERPKALATLAADVGTIVHDLANLTEQGLTKEVKAKLAVYIELPEWPLIELAYHKFLEWHSRNRDEVIAAEAIVALPCPLHRTTEDELYEQTSFIVSLGSHRFCTCYAGKFDALRRRGGRIILSDFKTSTGIYVDMFIQLGAYKPAIEYWLGMDIDGLEILRFGKEKGKEFETLLITNRDDIMDFQRQALLCRETYAFKRAFDVDDRFRYMGPKVKKPTLIKKDKKNAKTTGDIQHDSSGGEKTAGKVASVLSDATNANGVGPVGETVS
jgi:hypothetical protein